MKLIMENFRQFLDEAAKSLTDLGEFKVFIHSESDYEYIGIGTDDNHEAIGGIEIGPIDCDSKVWYVSQVESKDGWGPLLYDIAMERAVARGRNGLTSDKTTSTSNEAVKVWQYYLDNRAGEFEIKRIWDFCKPWPQPKLKSRPHDRLTYKDKEFKALTSVFRVKKKHLIVALRKANKLVYRRE